MKVNFKYVVEDTDRHGNVRLYYRRRGKPKIRLRGPSGSPEFLQDYNAAIAENIKPKASRYHKPENGSIRWLCASYFGSKGYKGLDESTQRVRRRILERFCYVHGEKPYQLLEAQHIRRILDEMTETPEAANGLLKAFRQVLAHGVDYELVVRNVAKDVAYIEAKGAGSHSWSLDEIEQFENEHRIGTRAHLALSLLLYTGQRRSDVVQFGRQHVKDGWLVFTQHKNRNRNPVRLEIPIIPQLQRAIDATVCGDLTFLVTSFGKPFTANGFGNRFRKWCDAAGLPHCSAHGLRKSTATRLAELGCSEHEIMSITGHRTLKEVSRYTRAARQKVLAGNAMEKFAQNRQGGNKSVPLSDDTAKSGTPSESK